MPQHVAPTNLVPIGHQQLTPSVVTALTVPLGAKFAYLQAEGSDIRWLDNGAGGTDPSATLGMLLIAGQSPFPYPGDLDDIRFIDDALTSGTLNVTYYGYFGTKVGN